MDASSTWTSCSSCKRPIGFRQTYYRCSVSTCNRPRTALAFCSVDCWDAHVPVLRHRDAWAEEGRAPSEEEWRRAQEATLEEPTAARRRIAPASADSPSEEPAREVLVVVSRVKSYVQARAGLKTADGVMDVLSDILRELCDEAIAEARRQGRKTVLERDIPPV